MRHLPVRPFISLKGFLKRIYPFVVAVASFHYHTSRVVTAPFRPRYRRRLSFAFAGFSLVLLGITGAAYFFVFKDLPSPSTLSSQPIPLTTHIRDRHGNELYKIYGPQNRTLIKLNELPPYVRQAVVSIEDKDFYHHRGFSMTGIVRAAWRTINNYRLEGGSTITQQLVKTSLLTPERTLQRKLRELVLSLMVENMYTKDQILEMYLNRVSFGGAAYGIEEASQSYFGKSAKDLTLSESSLLAGLPASPTTYSPFGLHPELAKSRQKEVLRRMVDDGHISWDEAENASAEELVFKTPGGNIIAPHFVMYVKDLLAQKYGADVVEQGGLDVTTSLDLETQQLAQSVVTQEVAKIQHLRISNGAALVTNPQTGEILAMVGSRDYFDLKNDGNVNVTVSPRQPGSSIKPINYALALSRGFTPATIIEDSPITYRTPGSPPYSPLNYDNRFHGKVTLRSALANSYNVPAVKVLSANGVNNMIDLGERMGITTWNDRDRFGLSLTLGGGEVKMVDMAVAYGTFATGGRKVGLHPIISVKDSQGRVLEEFRCSPAVSWWGKLFTAHAAESASATEITSCPSVEVLDSKVAFLISDILSDNAARTPTFGPRSDLFIPDRQVAVKTGTTNNLRDNWTIGYTPDRLVAVWVGNNDNTPMSYVASGVTGASPIWKKIMGKLVENSAPIVFTPPPGIVKLGICASTGQLSCSACSNRSEYFIEGTQPRSACTDDTLQAQVSPVPTPPPVRKDPRDRDKLLQGIRTFRR